MEEICSYKLSSGDLKESETRFHPDAPNVEAGPLTENSFWTGNFNVIIN